MKSNTKKLISKGVADFNDDKQLRMLYHKKCTWADIIFISDTHTNIKLCIQLIEKYEVQRFNIEKLHKTIDQLLIIKVERDKLQEEKELLMEVNSKYDYHIEELKNKVRLLMGELHSQKEGRSAGKAVQEQIKAFNLVDSSTQTIGSSTSVVSSFSKVEGAAQNQGERSSVATAAERSSAAGLETAAPPPPPPAAPEDGTLIPPPPPIPFGKARITFIIKNGLVPRLLDLLKTCKKKIRECVEKIRGAW